MRGPGVLLGWALLAGMVFAIDASAAELTPRQQQMVQVIQGTVQKAGIAYATERYEDAGQSLREAMRQIGLATEGGSVELYDRLVPVMDRITKAHAMVEFEGVTLPPFRRPERPSQSTAAMPVADSTAGSAAAGQPSTLPTMREASPSSPVSVSPAAEPRSGSAAGAEVSFTQTVAPILANRCGRCHIASSKGRFNLGSFASLMKGPPEGVVVFAGDTVGSRLIETIETGDMPRGGGRVPPAELAALKSWIMAGAKFDGDDPAAPLAGTPGSDAGNSPTQTSPPPAVRRVSGSETVSFAADIAPLLIENCNGCHINSMQTRGGLRMDTFAQLLRGGDSGAAIVPGNGEASLLVQKLRGTSGARMPAGGRPALADKSIALISTWIDEGATLDGASETQPLRVMSQLAWVASATPDEVSQRRLQLAQDNLKLVMAGGGSLQTKTTEHFQVLGSASQGTVDMVADLAEQQMKTVRTVVSGDPGEAFFDGRATIFVMPRRYDYSEFAKMVESRGVPADWTSHWQFDGIDAYVALVAGERDSEQELEARLIAPLVSLAVATRGGDVPRWFAEGVGVTVASRTRGIDREARRQADVETSQAVAAMKNAKQFLDGKLTPEQADRIGSAVATSLLDRTRRRGFDNLMRNLAAGTSFDRAFEQSFGAPLEPFLDAWTKWVRGS